MIAALVMDEHVCTYMSQNLSSHNETLLQETYALVSYAKRKEYTNLYLPLCAHAHFICVCMRVYAFVCVCVCVCVCEYVCMCV